MKRIILIGTCHDYQIPGRAGSKEFRAFIEELCSVHKIVAIAEEHSQDALQDAKAVETVCKQAADALMIRHLYADPGRKTREELGILQRNVIIMQNWVNNATDVEQELRASHAMRERYWFDRLSELNRWPVLFACGADHVIGFSALLSSQGLSAQTIESDWSPRWGMRET